MENESKVARGSGWTRRNCFAGVHRILHAGWECTSRSARATLVAGGGGAWATILYRVSRSSQQLRSKKYVLSLIKHRRRTLVVTMCLEGLAEDVTSHYR